jgi:hypothetical protein
MLDRASWQLSAARRILFLWFFISGDLGLIGYLSRGLLACQASRSNTTSHPLTTRQRQLGNAAIAASRLT